MTGMLEGLRVIEQGTFITGPAAGVLLADLGADVIKIEKPGTGDPFRQTTDGGLYNANFQAFNRNKRSIALDTSDPADLAAFDELVSSADVFIQNFRPGVADRLQVGEARLRALNPRLVYCSISGFGQTGPAAQRPCYDTVAQAMSGFMHLMLNPENPRVLGPAIADSVTGLYAVYGVLAALHERSRTGVGRALDVSMFGAMTHFNMDSFTHYFTDGEMMQPYSRPAASQAHVLTCSDGKRIALHMSTPMKFWESLVSATERHELLADERFAQREARIRNHGAVIRELAPTFLTRTLAEWSERLEAHDVPYAPVYEAPEVLQDPQARHIGIEVSVDDARHGNFRTVINPVAYGSGGEVPLRPPPFLDEHRGQILGAETVDGRRTPIAW